MLEMREITKLFPGVKALDNVNFKVKQGEIHALCGENGAGKSTLMKVLSGVYPYGSYEGEIYFAQEQCQFKDINESESLGIVIIHQELALIPYLSIAENIFLGNERANKGIINWNETIRQTKNYLDIVGLKEAPETLISNIGVGKQQLVEIAKAISKKVKLLILDEPTAALNEDDSENLLKLLLSFKEQGMTSIIISHKLNEINKVADSITILRDGQTIETLHKETIKITEERIISGMVGRDLENRYPTREANLGDVIFEVKNWNVYHPLHADRKVVDNVDFYIKRGEIVGIAGLMGAGRTELAMSVFGKSYGNKISGQLYKDGKELKINNVSDAIKAGIAYVTENRKENGLLLQESVTKNISLASLEKLSKKGVVNQYKEMIEAKVYCQKLQIKTPSIFQLTGHLSGGNQQKVVLSKWIFAEPDILLLDEPTRGIDVGAKYEIYTIINELASQGKGVCIISSELLEVLGMCDRIYAMSEGKMMGEVMKEEATEERVMGYMTRTNEKERE